ncbi:hypothetical protein YQE_10915, partial [Dendroctonus ponderosae]
MHGTKPKAQSTPNREPHCRRSVRDYRDENMSPVPLMESALPSDRSPNLRELSGSPRARLHRQGETPEGSESGSDDSDQCEEPDQEPRRRSEYAQVASRPRQPSVQPAKAVSLRPRQPSVQPAKAVSSQGCFWLVLVFMIAVPVGTGYYLSLNGTKCEKTSTKELKRDFSPPKLEGFGQDPFFWSDIRVQIEEVLAFASPRSIVFLHQKADAPKMRRIVATVAANAACYLRCCHAVPLQLNSTHVKNRTSIDDYGVLSDRYRADLEASGVLIMDNLTELSGTDAQMFHLFCDDSAPVVAQALILFTVEVATLPEAGSEAAELRRVLAARWTDIGRGDKFDPLFVRIAGQIVTIRS